MKRIISLLLLAIAISCLNPMPVEAQFLKKLGDALGKIANSGTQTSKSNSKNASSNSSASKSKYEPLYQIHTTANTKKMVIRGGASQLCPFSCGVALVNPRYGQWFVIDKQGNKLYELPEGYEPCGEKFDYERLIISTSSNYYMSDRHVLIINTNGQTVKDFGMVKSASAIIDGVARITVYEKREKKTYYVDHNGSVLSRTLPASKLFRLHDGLRIFGHDTGLSTKGPWGFCDAKCNIIIPDKFRDVGNFYNGLAVAQNDDGLWGVIDKTGQWVIQPQFSILPTDFEGPCSMVKDKSGFKFFMNKQGDFVWKDPNPNESKDVRAFMSTGYAVWSYDGGRKNYLIDSSFKKTALISENIPFGSGEVVNYNDQYFQWKWNNVGHINRLIDWKGNTLLEFGGDAIMSEGVCFIGSKYYFSDRGEIIVEFEDTQF